MTTPNRIRIELEKGDGDEMATRAGLANDLLRAIGLSQLRVEVFMGAYIMVNVRHNTYFEFDDGGVWFNLDQLATLARS